MGPFRHEPRNERHFLFIKKMRHALDGDRLDRWIGHDHFLVTRRGGIAFIGGVDVGPEHFAQAAELRHEPVQNLFRLYVGDVAIELVEAL
jgi:hypothetical protein